MIGTIRRRAIFSDDGDVIFVFDFSIKRRHGTDNSGLAVNVELPVVAANLLDAVCHLQRQQLPPLYQSSSPQ